MKFHPDEGADRNWRDGSENYLLEVLSRTKDRSSASDELAEHIVDWPTRYHFDRARMNLLHPLGFRPGLRVLDMGAGSGVASRAVAERGASVVALEGDALRAEAARIRCEGLDVQVIHGGIAELEDNHSDFDIILCIGVLEYSGDKPSAFLQELVDRLALDGVLVTAIENRFGLAYWLGANEDHLGSPWVGLEGYPAHAATPATEAIRTFGRRHLVDLLTGAGLTAQRWLTPYPDYKLPTAILDEKIHDEPDAVDLVDQLVGPPLDRSRMGGKFAGDERAVHRGVLEAGFGPEIANSFLILGSRNASVIGALCDPSVLAWRFTGDRRRSFLRVRTVRSVNGIRTIDRLPVYPSIQEPEPIARDNATWLKLRQTDATPQTYIVGPNLEQRALHCLRNGDLTGLEAVFGQWTTIASGAAAQRDVSAEEVHPFLLAGSRHVLPGDHLDLGFDNLAGAGGDEPPSFIDNEWEAQGGVDLQLVAIRACWKLATVTIQSGTRHPWSTSTSVDDLTSTFCDLLAIEVDSNPLERFRLAEAELRTVALGGTVAKHVAQLRAAGRRSLENRSVGAGPPSNGLLGLLASVRQIPVIGHQIARIVRLLRRV